MSRFLSRTAVVTTLLAIALLAPGRAAAASPCWRQIMNDWSAHGRITGTYPIHCYREAYANMSEDVRDYTSLGDDIQSALQAALIGSRNHARHTSGRSLQGSEVSSLGPSNADSIPLPLLILAGLATLLLAAGSAGALARKLEARRAPADDGHSRPRS